MVTADPALPAGPVFAADFGPRRRRRVAAARERSSEMPGNEEPSRTWFERHGGAILAGGVFAFLALIILVKNACG